MKNRKRDEFFQILVARIWKNSHGKQRVQEIVNAVPTSSGEEYLARSSTFRQRQERELHRRAPTVQEKVMNSSVQVFS